MMTWDKVTEIQEISNHAGMQKEELRAGGKTQTRWGPAGLQLIFVSSTSGSPSCGGRT